MSTQPNETIVSSPVLFCEGLHYYLSNFSAFMVDWRGQTWMTSEHAYQAAKFMTACHPDIVELIRASRSPREAKEIAQSHLSKIPEWSEEKKLSIMRDIVWHKLAQHTWIEEMLLETGDRELIENSPTDYFWGRGTNGTGRNELGKIWMSLRADLFEQVSAT